MNIRYTLGCLARIPLLPLMYYQGKQIRARVPRLPEATGTEGFAEPGKATSKTIRLLSVGESTIAGVGVHTHEEGFTGALARLLAEALKAVVHWKVYARSGYTAARVAGSIVPAMTDETVNLIVIGLGGNDAFTLRSPRQWRRDIRRLIEGLQAKYPQALIVFCNMPPIKEFPAFTPLIRFTIGNLVEILGQELMATVKDYNNVYYAEETISLPEWVARYELDQDVKAFFSDGVHPSGLTYRTWARDLASRVIIDKLLPSLARE
ncbi:SGNH/GDSL hydrolase family protein [Roseivirga sp. BDSF3-8]|uniref:SGNH/GDSL hydrolase family protein n=1 Tax=Roseivirga sp. BDSF3-8 TaxID=3241598 RepID=UPI003531EAA1